MQLKRTWLVPLSLVLAATLCSLSLPPEEKAKNLKVLPKNISHDDLIKEMRGYNKALGVKCDYCHAKQADNPQKMDFASDAKEEKEIARDMLKMTYRINKKFFKSGKDEKGMQVMTVTCYTCHNGQKEPSSRPPAAEEGARQH
ncbi:c-type cytochrome [Chitinophaga rhizophila]|uniref:Photosynthetic reaction center cytochrome c subunit n=1 Tax=Chitinophaga rhizophila TaxID=2866212 RepID=A0ABS7GCC0_9BACT|nr:c-type cytochrome [Chitinophaga rhizophila]MBW8685317.1 c-type cytochrome [Chitinophaga rhizophila]